MNKLLLAAVLLFAACSSRDGVVNEVMPESSVTLFSGGRSVCSGVAIGGGYFLTAAHCTRGPLALKRVIEHEDPVKNEIIFDVFEVMFANKKYDVALLYLEDNDHPTSPLACRPPRVGERILAITTPQGQAGIHSWGRVSGTGRPFNAYGAAWDTITPLNIMAAPGSSGGPIYNASGGVLGIVVGGPAPFGNFTFMVPAMIICKVLGRPTAKT